MCSIWMLIISQHVAVRNRRSQQSCASGCSSLFYIAENSGSAACLARRMRRADAALRCQCSSFSSSLNTPWKLRSKMKIWNLFEELGIAGKTKVKHFCKSQCSSFSTLLNQGPLITDGRNSNEMWVSKISLWSHPRWDWKWMTKNRAGSNSTSQGC